MDRNRIESRVMDSMTLSGHGPYPAVRAAFIEKQNGGPGLRVATGRCGIAIGT